MAFSLITCLYVLPPVQTPNKLNLAPPPLYGPQRRRERPEVETIQGSGFRFQGSGFRVQGAGFQVSGWFRGSGSGFRDSGFEPQRGRDRLQASFLNLIMRFQS